MATPALLEDATVASSDQDLMLAYGGGDAGAFDVLYARHKGGVYRYLLRHCGNAGTADELFQDVWMNVIRSRDTYAPTAKFTTWLYRIAHNRVVDHWRTAGYGEQLAGDHGDEDAMFAAVPATRTSEPHVRAESRELGDRMRAAVASLPALQRDAFLLHVECGLPVSEIAILAGSNVETVKSRLRYASNRLRALLGDLQ